MGPGLILSGVSAVLGPGVTVTALPAGDTKLPTFPEETLELVTTLVCDIMLESEPERNVVVKGKRNWLMHN